MKTSRRNFFKKAAAVSAGSVLLTGTSRASNNPDDRRYDALDEVYSKPVLKRELFPDPVIIDTLESPTSDLQSYGGVVKVPAGPGLGVEIDPDYIRKHQLVK